MKLSRRQLLFFFLIFSLVPASSAQSAGWSPLKSQDGNFSVLMPGTPSYQQDDRKSFVGNIVTHIWSLKTKNGEFSASYSDLPGIAVDLGGEGTIFDKSKKGLLKENGGAEQSFVETRVAGFPAKTLSFSVAASSATGQANFILVHKRLYVLTASQGPAGNAGNVSKYLNSFKLLTVPQK